MSAADVALGGPAWLADAVAEVAPGSLGDDAAAMALAVGLARRNVEAGTGGPFGAVVVDGEGRLLGAGVNVVVAASASLAHAEVMALLRAQAAVGAPRLLGAAPSPVALVTSAQPCVMCFGALFWAGLDVLVVGARTEDVERLAGFDEGPVPPDWRALLAAHGVQTRVDVLRDEAAAVLGAYGSGRGTRY